MIFPRSSESSGQMINSEWSIFLDLEIVQCVTKLKAIIRHIFFEAYDNHATKLKGGKEGNLTTKIVHIGKRFVPVSQAPLTINSSIFELSCSFQEVNLKLDVSKGHDCCS